MLVFPGMLSTPGGWLLTVGGALTLIASLLMALDQFRDAAGHSSGSSKSDEPGKSAPDKAPGRPRSFIFIGIFAFPISIGGFWGGGPRRRALGALYLMGLIMAATGALLLVLP